MEFTVINKSKKPNSTAITIESKEPYTYYIREFEGDLTGLDDETLIKRVLDLILVELDPSGAVAKMQTVIKEAQSKLEQATNRTIVNSDAMMELTATLSAYIAEIKERLHALDGQGEAEEATEEHHETTTQPVATTEEKHEETPQPTAPVATEPPVQPVAEPQPVVTPAAETTVTVTPTTVQGDGNNESNGKVEEHNAETTTSGNNSVQ
jgi:hypothetical protein|uniref:Uncharacterized protein n=1 Tax=Siphoviridae sp. ctFNZ2 TaxID=2823572 RepID=A0A8S5LAF0_9CAUD|nr:MAG TPA: Protein of unknown function DUF1366 [Siphoviridae sp. ctFNZ2]DAR44856.1 MAG TPA: Protein of unknown function (DUF1366) [Caudoviricetes sp.]